MRYSRTSRSTVFFLCTTYTLPCNMSPIWHARRAFASTVEFSPSSTAVMQGNSEPTSERSRLQTDHSVPPQTVPLLIAQEPTIFQTPLQQGMTWGMKLGIAMIPVVVCLVGFWVFFLFWLRKRRARKSKSQAVPPVPRIDHPSFHGSIESNHRSSKVVSMTAFSTPIYSGKHREMSIIGQARTFDLEEAISPRYEPNLSVTLAPPDHPALRDSPVDSGSPFRLKRGDTVKRQTLGTEISTLWPSPPPSAWIK